VVFQEIPPPIFVIGAILVILGILFVVRKAS
jgi:drug/metabolite transporter (DMT)-like permease